MPTGRGPEALSSITRTRSQAGRTPKSQQPEETPIGADRPETTRLAPSPTGALHLGNARTFLINWAMARRRGWRIVLRIEDLDGPRIKPEAEREVIDLLSWLGLDWDEGPVRQSDDLTPYIRAMERLSEAGRAYPSEMSRREVEEAVSAPHAGAGETRFPPTLRPAAMPNRFEDTGANWRMVVEDRVVEFDDAFAGPQRRSPFETIGDFVLWTKRGAPAYQLAVVVDDHRQGVTQVVRGDDLLDSAARQLLLYDALAFRPRASHTHLPLVLGPDGRRLAKRHGDTRVASYRERGVEADRIVGLLGGWSGLERTPMSAGAFAEGFSLATLPPDPVICAPSDDAWLLEGAS